jgi:Ketosteroid isomerase-related protein
MGADENAAVVRRGYEAFNAADINALNEMFDESAVWHAPGRSSLAGDYEGVRRPSPTSAGGAGDRRDLPGRTGAPACR